MGSVFFCLALNSQVQVLLIQFPKWLELQKYAALPGKYVHLKIICLYLLRNSDICRFPLVRKALRTIKECIYACGTIQTLKQ